MTPMTNEQLDLIAKELPLIKAWVNAVEAKLFELLESGVEFQYVSLAPKRATRQWAGFTNEEVMNMLNKYGSLEVVAPRVPLTPAQAEKVLGKVVYRELSPYVDKVSSGMTLKFNLD